MTRALSDPNCTVTPQEVGYLGLWTSKLWGKNKLHTFSITFSLPAGSGVLMRSYISSRKEEKAHNQLTDSTNWYTGILRESEHTILQFFAGPFQMSSGNVNSFSWESCLPMHNFVHFSWYNMVRCVSICDITRLLGILKQGKTWKFTTKYTYTKVYGETLPAQETWKYVEGLTINFKMIHSEDNITFLLCLDNSLS